MKPDTIPTVVIQRYGVTLPEARVELTIDEIPTLTFYPTDRNAIVTLTFNPFDVQDLRKAWRNAHRNMRRKCASHWGFPIGKWKEPDTGRIDASLRIDQVFLRVHYWEPESGVNDFDVKMPKRELSRLISILVQNVGVWVY